MDFTINTQTIRFSKDPALLSSDKAIIIFLHDSLGCIELWRDFPSKLAQSTGCDVLSYDRQGYGKSTPFTNTKRNKNYLKEEAKTLGNIINKFELKNVILFGHSDGGSIALLCAALYSERIMGIITEGAHIFVEKETINGIIVASKLYATTNLKEKLTKYHGDKTEDVFNIWVETWLSDEFRSWNIEKYLPAIKCPSLIIQGEKDEYGTQKQVDVIVQKTFGNSTSVIIPNIGHTPHKETTALIIDETTRFIKEVLLSC